MIAKHFISTLENWRKEVSERETSFLMQCEISVFSVVLFSAKRFKDFGKVNALFCCNNGFISGRVFREI